MSIQIISNGSRWYGEEPATIAELIQVLAERPLDPSFELNGSGFVNDESFDTLRCFGNFHHHSHVFNIRGKRTELAELITAIGANIASPAYLELLGNITRYVNFNFDLTMERAAAVAAARHLPATVFQRLHNGEPTGSYGFNFDRSCTVGDILAYDHGFRSRVVAFAAPAISTV